MYIYFKYFKYKKGKIFIWIDGIFNKNLIVKLVVNSFLKLENLVVNNISFV